MVRNAYKTDGPLGPERTPAGAYYILQDLLYRAVALTNSSGYIVEAYDTDAYGNTLIFIEPGPDGRWFTDDDLQSDYAANEIIYCGYRFDTETQLYYVRNRTYNPVLGRWIQRDPIGYSGGINLYGYARGRVNDRQDPTGKNPMKKDCCKNQNCCGPDITDRLTAMAASVRNDWNALSFWSKMELCTVTTFTDPLNAWDVDGIDNGTADYGSPCFIGTGKCKSTVTVAGKCYWQAAVNYWLAGLIYSAMDSNWYTANYAKDFEVEVIFYSNVKIWDPTGQKQDWFYAGATGNATVVFPQPKYMLCKPCTVRAKPNNMAWKWGFLRGSA